VIPPPLGASIQAIVSPAKEDAKYAVASMMEAGLPIGWPQDHFWQVSDGHGDWRWLWPYNTPTRLDGSLLGGLITAIAALFGAPFWFDALQTITRLKGSAPSPDEKKKNRAAAN
jgi:hypothetical protein